MTKAKRDIRKTKLLAELEENPLVARACNKARIHRSNFYRWCIEDAQFKADAVTAIEKGRNKLNDFVESKLLESISSGSVQAMRFWLSHNAKQYTTINAAEIKRLRFYEELVFDLLDVAARGNDHMLIGVINKLREQEKQKIEIDRKKSEL
jgi:hypothetical protein